MATDYKLLAAQAESLIRDVPHNIANLANLSALLYKALPELNWAGFYLLEGDTLRHGGAGNRTQLVPDVHQFPGHIACDSASRSEIVIPVRSGGRIIGVLDIDSPVPARFSEADQEGLERIVQILEVHLTAPEA